MKHVLLALFTFAAIGTAEPGFAETPEEKGYRLMKMNDDQPIFQKVKGEAVLKIYGSTGDLRFHKKMVMGSFTESLGTTAEKENYICYCLEPADDNGNSYLMFNYKAQPDIKYAYLKGIRKAKKVTGADNRLSFFGSDFTNGDIGKPDINEWNYRYLGDERVEFKGRLFDCYAIESIPKTAAVLSDKGYARQVTFIEKKTLLTLKIEYFDENKIKMKEMKLLSFVSRNNVKGDRVYYYTGYEMKNVKRGTRTELFFKNMRFEEEANINPNIFSIEYMTRKWW